MKYLRSVAVTSFGVLLSLVLPMSGPTASAQAPARPAAEKLSAPAEIHHAKLTGIDPGKHGSDAAALAAYWTQEKQQQARANSERRERTAAVPNKTKKPPSDIKMRPPGGNETTRSLATDPSSNIDLPEEEERKLGVLYFTNPGDELDSCTAFLLPPGNKGGIIQTAAHCAIDLATGEDNENFAFLPAGTLSDPVPEEIFPVDRFEAGDWQPANPPEDAFGVNEERDYAFMALEPNANGETAEHLGSFQPAYPNPLLDVPVDTIVAGYPGEVNDLRICGREIRRTRDSDQLAHWKATEPDSQLSCKVVGGMSGGPLLQIIPNPCSDDVTFSAIGNHTGTLDGSAAGASNYRAMKTAYERLRDLGNGVSISRAANVNASDVPGGSKVSDASDDPGCEGPTAGPGAVGPELSFFNRTPPVSGMPDWSKAGYLGGEPLPANQDITGDATCRITPDQLASTYKVVPNDGVDDTTGFQKAIDFIKTKCSSAPQTGYRNLSLITLPAGRIDVSRQMYVDANFLVLRGQGSDDKGTKFVFRPDQNTRYDLLIQGRWDQDATVAGLGKDEGSGGWIWPGRGMFRVQTRDVATRYQDDWEAAPPNRKDLFEGSINQHWASGIKVLAKANDPGYSARQGEKLVRLDAKADMKKFTMGGYVWVGAANSVDFYHQQGVGDQDASLMENLHMRQEMFRVAAIDSTVKTITLDRPLEYDLPVDSTSDGSPQMFGSTYASKVTPLKVIEGVGFENFSFTQDMTGMPKLNGGTYNLTPTGAVHDYGNEAPEYAMHGIVFKWAANDWVRGIKATMTGSHPIVTEDALNLQIERNSFDGAWNKGKGGNGYLRGSRVWNSLYAYNLSRNLRHFTFQWSASGNVAFRNDLDSDLNLHGGWERYNLFEQNTVRVPYDHRSASCKANCGGEGGELDPGTWYPIWWAAGPKAVKWSGSSGPQNVFYNNIMTKQTSPGGPFVPYTPYGLHLGTAYQFGSNMLSPSQFQPLSQNGLLIPDWTARETVDYSAGHGVVERDMGGRPSLFLGG